MEVDGVQDLRSDLHGDGYAVRRLLGVERVAGRRRRLRLGHGLLADAEQFAYGGQAATLDRFATVGGELVGAGLARRIRPGFRRCARSDGQLKQLRGSLLQDAPDRRRFRRYDAGAGRRRVQPFAAARRRFRHSVGAVGWRVQRFTFRRETDGR